MSESFRICYCGTPVKKKHRKFCSNACSNRSPEKRVKSGKAGVKLRGIPKSSEYKEKLAKSLTGKKFHSLETKKRMSILRKGVRKSINHILKIQQAINKRVDSGTHKYPTNPKFKHGFYTSTKTGQVEYYDSSYELRRFKVLDSSSLVKLWTKKHKIRIPYFDLTKKRIRRYIPDILVEYEDGRFFLEETKGYVFNSLNFETKCSVARVYCKSRGIEYRVIFESDLDVLVI